MKPRAEKLCLVRSELLVGHEAGVAKLSELPEFGSDAIRRLLVGAQSGRVAEQREHLAQLLGRDLARGL